MPDYTVGHIQSVTIGIAQADCGHPRRQQPRRRPRRDPPLAQLIAAALPGVDPADCDVRREVDADGGLIGMTIIDAASGKALARLTLAQLARYGETGEQRGLLFERRG